MPENVSIRQLAAFCFNNEREQHEADDRYDADPKEHTDRAVKSVSAAGRDAADEERSDRRNQTADVVGKSRAGPAHPRGKQLRQIIGKASKHAKYSQPDREVKIETSSRIEIEAECAQQRSSRGSIVDQEHFLAAKQFCGRYREQRSQ